MGIALVIASRLMDRFDARPIIVAGLALTAAAMFAYTQIDAHTSLVLLSTAALMSGLGIGAALVPAMTGVYAGLGQDAVPRATTSIRIFQQLGGSFGIAILAVVLQQQTTGATTASALAAAYGHTFWWALAFTALAAVATLLLPSRRDDSSLAQLTARQKLAST